MPMSSNGDISCDAAYDQTLARISKNKTLLFDQLRRRFATLAAADRALGLQAPRSSHLGPQAYQMSKMKVAIKAHKKDFPIRPIIAAPSSMGIDIQEFFLHRLRRLYERGDSPVAEGQGYILARMTSHQHIVTDAATVCNELTDRVIAKGHRMYSIDFVSMYTNIDIGAAMQIIEGKFDVHIASTTSIRKAEFISLLRRLLQVNEHFTAGMRILVQKKGLPMGGQTLLCTVRNRNL